MEFGRIVRARRESAGLSRREVARTINVSPTTLTRWEKGLADPSTVKAVMWLLEGGIDGETEMWRARALLAEATLRDINAATVDYKIAIRVHSNGG